MGGGAHGFSMRSALFCAAVYFALGIYIPFFPLWLAEKGLDGTQIAVVIATPLFLRIAATPVLAAAAERLPHLGLAAAFYGLLAGLFLAALIPLEGYVAILVLSAAAQVCWNAVVPLLDAVILTGVREHRIEYARVRLWGSVGFIAASFAGAEAARRFGGEGALWLLGAAFFACGAAGLALPRVPGHLGAAESFGFRRAFSDRMLRSAILAGALITASHAALYAFGSLYWEAQGISAPEIGFFWAFSIAAEIAVFWSVKFLPAWGARHFLLAGALGSALRWILFPLCTSPAAALLLQSLHAVTFALSHLGVMMAIGAVAVRGHSARLQTAYQMSSALLLAVATLACGPIYQASPAALFWIMAGLAVPAVGLAASMWPAAQPQRLASGGSTRPSLE